MTKQDPKVSIKQELKDRLDTYLSKKGDTYSDIIERVVNEYEKLKNLLKDQLEKDWLTDKEETIAV